MHSGEIHISVNLIIDILRHIEIDILRSITCVTLYTLVMEIVKMLKMFLREFRNMQIECVGIVK